MRRISAYFISLLMIALANPAMAQDKDSIKVPLNIRTGFDIYGPAYYSFNRDNLTMEGYAAFDYDSKKSFVIESGYQNFKYSQYNYDYQSKGVFFKFGADFNLIKPFPAEGKYYGGIGVRYGISFYSSGVPSFKRDNYWGIGTGSISSANHVAHFVEVNPGIRTQIFRNVSIGWNIRLRLLVSGGTGSNQKAVSIPGFGNGTKVFSPGINYYISFNIPYKSVYVKPEIEKAPEPETITTTTDKKIN
jgi:hypothetical protein